MDTNPESAVQACEAILAEQIRYNNEHEILPSEIAIARRLLARRAELAEVYTELHAKLAHDPLALREFLDLLLRTRAHWGPEKIAQARSDRVQLVGVNQRIEKLAREVADLMDLRERLHNTSGFTSSTFYHIHDVIEAANQGNGLYRWHLREALADLRKFDMKYWPSLGDCLRAIADDAAASAPDATDPLIDAATTSSRASHSDFLMALFTHIEECRGTSPGSIPRSFKLSDAAMASLVNVLLDLSPDQLVDAIYVKGRRHRAKDLSMAKD